jgi:hypothetical protein
MELGLKYKERFSLNGIDPAKLAKLSMENAVLPCLLGKYCGKDCYSDLAVVIISFSTNTDDIVASLKFIDYLLFWYPSIQLTIFTQSGDLFRDKYQQVLFGYFSCDTENFIKGRDDGNVTIYNSVVKPNLTATCKFPDDFCVTADIVFITPGFRITTFELPICTRGERPNATDNTYIISNYNPNTYKAAIEYTSINTGIPSSKKHEKILVTYEYKIGTQKGTDKKIMNFGMFLDNNYSIKPITTKGTLNTRLANKPYSYVDVSLNNLVCTDDSIISCFTEYFKALSNYVVQNNLQKIYILWKPGRFNNDIPISSELYLNPNTQKIQLFGGGYNTLMYYCRILGTTQSLNLLSIMSRFSFIDTEARNLTDDDFIGLMQHSVPIVFLGREQSVSMYISAVKVLDDVYIFYMIAPDSVNFAYELGITGKEQGIRITEPDSYGNLAINTLSCCGILHPNTLKQLNIVPTNDFRFVGRYVIDALLYKANQDYKKKDYTCDTDFVNSLIEKFNIQQMMLTKGVLPTYQATDRLIKFDYKKYKDLFSEFSKLGNAGGFSGARVFLSNFKAKDGKEKSVFVKMVKLKGGKESRERARGAECSVDTINNTVICPKTPNDIGQVSENITMFASVTVINEEMIKGTTPNFTFTYYIGLEQVPLSVFSKQDRDNNTNVDALVYFQENVPNATDLGTFLTNSNANPQIIRNFVYICVQILANLLFIQRKWRMMHSDLWYQNVLLEKLSHPIQQNYCFNDGINQPVYISYKSDILVRIIDFDTVSLDVDGVRYGSASKGQADANVYAPYRDWLWLMWTIYRPQSAGKITNMNPDIKKWAEKQCIDIIGKPCDDTEVVISDKRQNENEGVPIHNLQTRSGLRNQWSEYIFGQFIPSIKEYVNTTIQPVPNVKYWCN